MAKDPAFLFYSNDFLSGTFAMSDEQVGKYVRILCIQHQKYRLSEKELFNLSGKDEDIISKFEKEQHEGKNYYYNIRLREEATKRSKYTESRRKNLDKDKDINSHMPPHMNKHMEDVIEDVNINKDINDIKSRKKNFFENLIPPVLKTMEFEIVWNEWIKYKSEIRNKVTESTAKKQLQFLEIHKENAIDIINQSIQSGWKGLFELNNKFNQNGTVKPRRNTLQDF